MIVRARHFLLHRASNQRRHLYGYTQAKALVFDKPGPPSEVLRLHSHSIPPPHSDLVTLRTLAAPINPADVNKVQGVYPSPSPSSTDLSTTNSSAVPGNEGCFEVIATGNNVQSLSRGDWVLPKSTSIGSWRSHLQIAESELWKVPDRNKLNEIQIGTIGVNAVTAWQLLRSFVPLQPGDWYVQNGSNSAVGRMVIQLGRLWGLRGIAVIRPQDTAAETESLKSELKALGAEHVVTGPELSREAVEQWTQADQQHESGQTRCGPKLGLNCVGGRVGMAVARVLAPGSQFITYGNMDKSPMRVGASIFIFADITFRGFWLSRWIAANGTEREQVVKELMKMMQSKQISAGPVRQVPWTQDVDLATLLAGVQNGERKNIFVFDKYDATT